MCQYAAMASTLAERAAGNGGERMAETLRECGLGGGVEDWQELCCWAASGIVQESIPRMNVLGPSTYQMEVRREHAGSEGDNKIGVWIG